MPSVVSYNVICEAKCLENICCWNSCLCKGLAVASLVPLLRCPLCEVIAAPLAHLPMVECKHSRMRDADSRGNSIRALYLFQMLTQVTR